MECQLPVCQWELLQFNLRVYKFHLQLRYIVHQYRKACIGLHTTLYSDI